MASYEFVDVPVVTPRKYGLYSVADVRMAQGHELQGIEHYTDNCNIDITATPNGEGFCVGTPTRTTTHTSQPYTQQESFTVYAYTSCAGVNEFADAQERAMRLLEVGEERAVEWKLQRLIETVAVGAANITPGTVPSLARGVALLEEYADTNYAGVPTFGASRAILSAMASTPDIADVHGTQMQTALGSPVFGGYLFGDKGPSATAPGATESWVWTMGKVTVRHGVAEVFGPVFIQTAGAVDEVQTVTITGTPTGGTFTLTFLGETTGNIAYNANAAAVQTALLALSNLDSGDVVVTGTNPSFILTFGGRYDSTNVGQVTATAALTGGTSPGVITGTTTEGVTGQTDNTYRTMASRVVVLDWDCLAAATKVTTPA